MKTRNTPLSTGACVLLMLFGLLLIRPALSEEAPGTGEKPGSARLGYTRVLKGSSPEYIGLTVNEDGTGTYDGRELAGGGRAGGLDLLANFLDPRPRVSYLQASLKKVLRREDLGTGEAENAMEEMTSGRATPARCWRCIRRGGGEEVSAGRSWAGGRTPISSACCRPSTTPPDTPASTWGRGAPSTAG